MKNFDELMETVLPILPYALIDEDNAHGGEIVVYTGLKEIVDEKGQHILIPLEGNMSSEASKIEYVPPRLQDPIKDEDN